MKNHRFFFIFIFTLFSAYINGVFAISCSSSCNSNSCCPDNCQTSKCQTTSCQPSCSQQTKSCKVDCCNASSNNVECCRQQPIGENCNNCPCPEHPTLPPSPPPPSTPLPALLLPPIPLPRLPTPHLQSPAPLPVIPPCSANHSNTCATSNNNNNSIIIPTNITIQNELHNENRITIPVNITVNNVNNIAIQRFEDDQVEVDRSKIREKENEVVYVNTTTNTTDRIDKRIVVMKPYIVPMPYYVTMPTPMPIPQLPREGCCQVVQPCQPYTFSGCQTSSHQCSNQCRQQYMYNSIDVCQQGCDRNRFAPGYQCNSAGCYNSMVDCNTCNMNFHRDYSSFLRCSGCYTPRNWGFQ